MGPEVVAISEKRCLSAAPAGNILNSGQTNTKASLRLAGQTAAVDPMEPGGGGIIHHDGEKSIGGNTLGADPAAALSAERFHCVFQQIAQYQTDIGQQKFRNRRILQLKIYPEAFSFCQGLVMPDQAGNGPTVSKGAHRPFQNICKFGEQCVGNDFAASNLKIVAQVVTEPAHLFEI